MPLDGLLIRAICTELKEKLEGGRIDKIMQPEKDEIHLLVRNHGENHRLLLSCNASLPRIHLTNTSKENPLQAPMFCMLLRKYLTNARIRLINQTEMDRIVEIHIEGMNEMSDTISIRLIHEIMGKHSNLILVNEFGVILDSALRVSADMSRIREVLPGLFYETPPAQDKVNPLSLSIDEIFYEITNAPSHMTLNKWLHMHFMGISSASANAIATIMGYNERVSLDSVSIDIQRRLAHLLFEFLSNRHAVHVICNEDEQPLEIFAFKPSGYEENSLISFESPSAALDYYYIAKDDVSRMQQKKANIQRVIQNHLGRCESKLAAQLEALKQCENMEQYRLYGELLTGHHSAIPRGSTSVNVLNYYDNTNIDISINPILSVAANAKAYFKRYKKAKNSLIITTEQIVKTKEEYQYLEGQLHYLALCQNEHDCEELRMELVQQGYMAKPKRQSKQKSLQKNASQPMRFKSGDGYTILIGRNNVQNDRLTFKTAAPHDIWLHTKDIPGSHVVILSEQREVPKETLLEAAMLAAYYSRARLSSNVPVDYALRRYVKKTNNAKPGFVIYTHQSTLFVNPSEGVSAKLSV